MLYTSPTIATIVRFDMTDVSGWFLVNYKKSIKEHGRISIVIAVANHGALNK